MEIPIRNKQIGSAASLKYLRVSCSALTQALLSSRQICRCICKHDPSRDLGPTSPPVAPSSFTHVASDPAAHVFPPPLVSSHSSRGLTIRRTIFRTPFTPSARLRLHCLLSHDLSATRLREDSDERVTGIQDGSRVRTHGRKAQLRRESFLSLMILLRTDGDCRRRTSSRHRVTQNSGSTGRRLQ